MIFRWLRAHASSAITTASVLVVGSLVTVLALVSTGYTEQKLELDDASVWVTNGSRQVVGRANTDVFELNTVVRSEGTDIDVLQRGSTVLTHDRTSNTLQLIDPAASVVVSTVPLPAGENDVSLIDGFVVIHSSETGGVWVVRESALDSFDPGTEPTLSLEKGSVVAVSNDGALAGFDRQSSRLVTVDVTTGEEPASRSIEGFEPGEADELQITIIGGVPAVLDVVTRTLAVGGRTVSLGGSVAASAALRLPAASDEAATLLLAHAGGLLGIDPSSGAIDSLVDGVQGVPAQPVANGDCSYAAWSDGSTWQRCGSGASVRGELTGATAVDDLSFRSNGHYVVLNDEKGGRVWAVQHDNRVIDNWDQLIDSTDVQQQDAPATNDSPPIIEKDQLPPVAIADELGARGGRASVLPVLLNDYDPNGDVLSITAVTQPDPAQGSVDIVNTSQQLQITLTPQATGTLTFDYTIADGRGGTASAAVTVTVRAPGENSAPVQARAHSAQVAAGGSFSTDVLGDWYDPDGDPMYLADAQTDDPDRVSFSPDGSIDYHDKGQVAADKQISLQVSDFTESGTGTVQVAVSTPGTVPITAEGFLVQGYTGQDVPVAPLPNVRGGTGALRLSNVADYPDARIVPNYAKGTFTFTSAKTGIFYLTYSVTDAAQQTATGTVRIDIAQAPDASTRPITVPTVAFLYQQQTELVDVLASDIDPAGGVLSITATSGVPAASGAVVEILEHRILRVRLNNLLAGPLQFTYTVTNGFSSSEGLVTVFQVPEPPRLQAPVAVPDRVSVRTGEVVDIPVLANDSHPNRKPLVLDPELVSSVPDGGGLLFASGSVLRYLAPDEPGDFTATYRVGTTADVQFDTAQVTITVREADAETNTAPVPPVLSARVVAGESVAIDVPVTSMDADGDTVRLVGAASNPQQGNVTVSGDTLTYTAGAASQGTDSFTYEVVDSLGARATGTVRVGITQGLDTASSPVAMDDVLITRPGTSLTVRVLENDSDPNASPLRIADVDSSDPLVAVTNTKDTITLVAPAAPGDYAVLYTIQNDSAQQASAWLRVRVDDDAPPVRPEADDTVVRLSDIIDRDTVTVDVMKNVFYAEGGVNDLAVSLVPGYDAGATVLSDGRIQIRVTQKSQVVPFQVARPDDPSVSARAFIRVPGLEDALPEVRTTAPPLQVSSGDSIRIAINDYVVAGGARSVQLTDQATVKASNASAASLVIDDRTLQFTSRDGYWGPASISFEVTDGSSATDPSGHRAVIVLPISVLPTENQPPVFTGAQVSLQPGDERVLELRDLTRYPYPDDVGQLAYAVNSQPGGAFSARLDGTRLTIAAAANAVAGTATEFQVGVRDAANDGKAGVIRLAVVTSNRPVTSPGADTLTIRRGQSASVPVLANDQATNPFPDTPLSVVAVAGVVPPGVTVTPSADKSTLAVSVAQGVDIAATGQVSLQYQVADATNDPNRYTWGTVTITIVDVPDTPVAPVLAGGGFVNGQLTLTAAPLPYPNGAPITSFIIKSDDNGGYSKDCGASATCVLTDLPAGVGYRFSSIAVNQYGQSPASPLSTELRSDYIPAAPQNVRIGREAADAGQGNEGVVVVSWNAIPDPAPGSAIRGITVQIGGTTLSVPRTATSARYQGVPGTEYTATVWAENGADALYPGQIPWNTATSPAATAAGKPVPSTPSATVVDDSGTVRVEWPGFSANGGAEPQYRLARYTASQAIPSCTQGEGARATSGATLSTSSAQMGLVFVYVVYADNGWGCSQAQSAPLRVLGPPPSPSVSLAYQNPVGGRYAVAVEDAVPKPLPNTEPSEYTISVSGGGAVASGTPLNGNGPWTFFSCISNLCSAAAAPTNSLAPVDANVSIATCQAGQDLSEGQIVTVPGGQGKSWTFRYAFDIGLGFVAFGDSSLVPPGTKRVAVQSVSADGRFTNGPTPDAVFAGSGKVCG